MKCPKCNRIIADDVTVCPHCHKVLSLVCPNCHSISQNSVCSKCGYIILEKCAKCGRMTPTTMENCKCGFSVKSSIACNECETDEFASLTIKFGALGAIRNLLASQDLYSKFLIKLKNLINSQLKGIEGNIITHGNEYEINFNKELSLATSVNKAVRLSIKILNAFAGINLKMQDELGTSLKINLIIQKKTASELLTRKSIENNVKVLMTGKVEKRFLKGMQVIMDQFSRDCINREYHTDSLYLLEQDGYSVMYYELLLGEYVLPPSSETDTPVEIAKYREIHKANNSEEDIYGFKIFDINAKCHFTKSYSGNLLSSINPNNKILSLKGDNELQVSTKSIAELYKENGFESLYVSCTEEMKYKPWGFFEKLFKEGLNLPVVTGLIQNELDGKPFKCIQDIIFGNPINSSAPEDARYRCMEAFCSFLSTIKNTVIIIDGFENIDDTSIQTLEIYFDNFKKLNNIFVFTTDSQTSVHSRIKGLLRTPVYTEITLAKNPPELLLADIKEEANDFIQSFYYEKIKENFNGSKLYFDHAIKYLIDKDVLASFKGKLIVKNGNSVILPKNLKGLIKNRLKTIRKNQDASMIMAYSLFFGERLDFETLEQLGVKNIKENAELLEKSGFTFTKNNAVYFNNFSLIKEYFDASLKPEMKEFLAKNIIAKLGKNLDDTTLLTLMGFIGQYKEKYLLLWKNSQRAISTGDYDAYLKNCLSFLSIIDKIENNIPQEEIEKNKKDVYEKILMSLYKYSPEKIYPIEKILLMDEINNNNNEKIVKLSNLMLQGALISSNYSEALSALQNILERCENPSLIVDGAINTKFLLLSLVNIEILFNLGDFERCIELGEELTKVIKPDIIEKIKPVNFSTNLFVSHLSETFRLVAFAKLLMLDSDLNEFFESVKNSLNAELPEKDCIIAIKDFLRGKNYTPSNIQNAQPFSKIIFLILQELSQTNKKYKIFAQNIYQAKLLAADIHQAQLEFICDLLIAYAYAKSGVPQKADAIFDDVLKKSENSAIFNINVITNYLMAKTKLENGNTEDALLIINNALGYIQKHNKSKVFYAMFEKLYINAAEKEKLPIDIMSEQQKLAALSPDNELERIIRSSEFIQQQEPETTEIPEEETPEPFEEVSDEQSDNPEDDGDDDFDLETMVHE